MFTPLLVMATLLLWCCGFVMVYIGHDLGDVPITVTGIALLVMTSFVLVFH